MDHSSAALVTIIRFPKVHDRLEEVIQFKLKLRMNVTQTETPIIYQCKSSQKIAEEEEDNDESSDDGDTMDVDVDEAVGGRRRVVGFDGGDAVEVDVGGLEGAEEGGVRVPGARRVRE